MAEPRPWSPHLRGLRSDEGASIIEVAITIVIMSIAFIVILGGMTTAITSSVLHREQTTADTILRSYGEAIKALNYEECASTYSPPEFDDPNDEAFAGYGPDPFPPTVLYWHPDPFDNKTGIFDGTCTDVDEAVTGVQDEGVQMVIIGLKAPDGGLIEPGTLELIKRRKAGEDLP